MRKGFGLLCIMIIMVLCGCSTVCPPVLKFGTWATVCLPYETVQLAQPIAVWNDHPAPSDSTAAAMPNAGAANNVNVRVSGYSQQLPLLKIEDANKIPQSDSQ